jgi:hypothetical protein
MRTFRRRLKKLSPRGRLDISMILIAADAKIPYSKLRPPRLADALQLMKKK